MSFYVSIVRGSRSALLAGPYRRHGDALRAVKPASIEAQRVDQWAAFDAFGTVQVRTGHDVLGKLNDRLGLTLDADGYVDVEAAA